MDVPTRLQRMPWPCVAALAGALASSVAAALLATSYHLRFADVVGDWPWSTWAWSIAILAPVCGAAWGVIACGGIVLGRKRGRPLLGAVLGGAVGGLLPSLVGVAGYGSLHAPYAGTGTIAFSVLLGIYLFASLGSLPAATGRPRQLGASRTLLASALASVFVAMPFGLVCTTLAVAALPEPVVRDVVNWLGNSPCDSSLGVLIPLGIIVAGSAGAALGLFVGLTTQLATILRHALR